MGQAEIQDSDNEADSIIETEPSKKTRRKAHRYVKGFKLMKLKRNLCGLESIAYDFLN